MALEVSSMVIGRLLQEASRARPAECCGILLGSEGRITAIEPTLNVHPVPRSHFEIEPQALIDAHRAARGGGPQVLGYYHSHPAGDPVPSTTDRAKAAHDGLVWAIIGANAVRFWKDAPNGFQTLSYTLSDG